MSNHNSVTELWINVHRHVQTLLKSKVVGSTFAGTNKGSFSFSIIAYYLNPYKEKQVGSFTQ